MEEKQATQKASQQISANILAFIKKAEPNPFSTKGLIYTVCVLALDGTVLHEGQAMSEDEAKEICGIKDERHDKIFYAHYTQWRIKWVKGGEPEFKQAMENYRNKQKQAPGAGSVGQTATASPGAQAFSAEGNINAQTGGQNEATGTQSSLKAEKQAAPGAQRKPGRPKNPAKIAEQQQAGESMAAPAAEPSLAETAQSMQNAGTAGAAASPAPGTAGAPDPAAPGTADPQAAGKQEATAAEPVAIEQPILSPGEGETVEIIHLNLPVKQSQEKQAELGRRAMVLLADADRIERARKAAADVFKGEAAQVDESLQAIRKQYEEAVFTTVPCTVRRNAENKIMEVVRNDTREAVNEKTWQPVLNLKTKEQAETETPKEASPETYIIMFDPYNGNPYKTEKWTEDGWKEWPTDKLMPGDVFRRKDSEGKVVMEGDPGTEGACEVFKLMETMNTSSDKPTAHCMKWALETVSPIDKNNIETGEDENGERE